MQKRERHFIDNLSDKSKTYVHHPRWFHLAAGDKYMPDFFCNEDHEYIELAGTRQAYHKNKEKYQRFQQEYKAVKFRVVYLDADGCIKPQKQASALKQYIKHNYGTTAAFAKKLGKSQQSVSLYCHGRVPRDVAIKIVKVTRGKVSLSDLWGIKKLA